MALESVRRGRRRSARRVPSSPIYDREHSRAGAHRPTRFSTVLSRFISFRFRENSPKEDGVACILFAPPVGGWCACCSETSSKCTCRPIKECCVVRPSVEDNQPIQRALRAKAGGKALEPTHAITHAKIAFLTQIFSQTPSRTQSLHRQSPTVVSQSQLRVVSSEAPRPR